jgi:hypothetical protein
MSISKKTFEGDNVPFSVTLKIQTVSLPRISVQIVIGGPKDSFIMGCIRIRRPLWFIILKEYWHKESLQENRSKEINASIFLVRRIKIYLLCGVILSVSLLRKTAQKGSI